MKEPRKKTESFTRRLKKRAGKTVEWILFFVPLCFPIGFPLLFIIYGALRLFGRIEIRNLERLKDITGSALLVPNHPTFLEPILIPLLFFPRCLLNPFRFLPWNTPDKRKYYDKWWYLLAGLRIRSIPIDRDNREGHAGRLVILRIMRILKNKGKIVLFFESTRTHKTEKREQSRKGKELGQLKEVAGWLAISSQAPIVPIWVDGTPDFLPNKLPLPRPWKKIIINVGHPFVMPKNISPEKATKVISLSLLGLADK